MHTTADELVPSSEELLHEFLTRSTWRRSSTNSITLLQRDGGPSAASEAVVGGQPAVLVGTSVDVANRGATLLIHTDWRFATPRREFRWMRVLASSESDSFEVVRGLIAPETTASADTDTWRVHPPPGTPPGNYKLRIYVVDQLRAAWNPAAAAEPLGFVTQIVSPGTFRLEAPGGE
jgi:hypothetical protein